MEKIKCEDAMLKMACMFDQIMAAIAAVHESEELQEKVGALPGALIPLCYVLRDETTREAAAKFMKEHPLDEKASEDLVMLLFVCATIGVNRIGSDSFSDEDSEIDLKKVSTVGDA